MPNAEDLKAVIRFDWSGPGWFLIPHVYKGELHGRHSCGLSGS